MANCHGFGGDASSRTQPALGRGPSNAVEAASFHTLAARFPVQRVSRALFGCPTTIGLVVKKIELQGTQMDRPPYPIQLGRGGRPGLSRATGDSLADTSGTRILH
jgi:hypothetical protein